ncbi:MAG TPA: hypothetical protein VGL85_21690 [Phenylobacterium sp.]
MKIRAMVLSAAVVASLAAPGLAYAQLQGDDAQATPGTRFKCQDGGELIARFDSRGARLVAIVDDGLGPPHALPIKPWTGGPVQLTWSDGQRTLTWSPGVQIMWMNGDGAHHMCGREGGHHH